MKKQVRVMFLFAIAALALGWLSLHAENERLATAATRAPAAAETP